MMKWIPANWPAPKNIIAGSTTREFGFSQAPYHACNLGLNTKDNPVHVEKNRQYISQALDFPNSPIWLKQVHEETCLQADCKTLEKNPVADASYTDKSQIVCTVLTADCLPVLLCNKTGTKIAAVHAGWKGLQKNIITQAIWHLQTEPSELMAYFAPSICQDCYEIDIALLSLFTQKNCAYAQAFRMSKNNDDKKRQLSLTLLARIELETLGVDRIYESPYCTTCDNLLFYSHRKEKETGRFASFIFRSN
jgi:polyphenol oxidase